MIVQMNVLLNRTVVLTVTDASTTCGVVIFSVKVSCITSVLNYGHWCDWSIKALSTHIRFHLKTQLFLYGHGFRAHLSDENDQWKRNFRKRSPEQNFLKTLSSCVRVARRKRNFSKTLKTHYQSQSTLRNIRTDLFKMTDGRFLSCLLYLGLFLT